MKNASDGEFVRLPLLRWSKLGTALAFVMLASGCAHVDKPAEYQVSRDTLFMLKANVDGRATLGSFSQTERLPPVRLLELDCFGVEKVGPPGGGTYAEYVRAALERELRTAGVYGTETSPVITATLDQVDLQRRPPYEARWLISLSLVSTNGSSLKVSRAFDFDVGSLVGSNVCRKINDALPLVVQKLLEDASRSPMFANLFG